jgi:lysophospholipase L1-like esterase
MDQLVSELKKSNPNTCILLTTPPDSYFKKKYVNKQVDRIRHAILLYCEKQEIACYDLYSAMGGENSIVSWQQQGLAATDLVHFTKSGYQLQGEMFYESFIKAYTTYATNRSE